MPSGNRSRGQTRDAIAEAVFSQVRRVLPPEFHAAITLRTSLYEIGLDSLTRMEVLNCLEEAFKPRFSEEALYDMETCSDLVQYIRTMVAPRNASANAAVAEAAQVSEQPPKRDIHPQDWDVTQFPECLQFRQRLASTASMGIENLPQFLAVKQRHHALLYVDEAHSVGVMGPTGRGICEHFGVDPAQGDLWMGTISKALGSGGGYLAGRAILIEYLQYTTPSFVFATAMSPANAAAALEALRVVQEEPQRVSRLRDRSRLFLELAQQHGLNTGGSRDTPIIPIILGDSLRCLRASAELLRRGIDAQPILYPAVPESASRVRFFLTAEHTEEQIRYTAQTLAECLVSDGTAALYSSRPA